MRVQLADNIFWVGAVDWHVRDFHGYSTTRGSTYNAYLIIDEKIALIDSVKAPFAETLLANVAELTDPAKIDYLVSNHVEPDHSGSAYRMLEAAPQAELIASAKGVAGLRTYYGEARQVREVNTGDEISLGRHTLHFIHTPMLHWPDSMFTYAPEEKLLFSMDAFGQHLASSGRFDEEVPFDVLMAEAKKYYANIVMPFGKIVTKTLAAASELETETIAPSHGIIWRKHIPDALAAYAEWAVCKPTAKVLVLYDSMWDSTEIMAEAIYDGVVKSGVDCSLVKVPKNDLTDMATDVLDAAAIAVGTPTLNNGMMPKVAAFLTYIMGLRPTGKVGFTFGSHGWSGGGAAQASEMLERTKVELLREPITCRFRPTEDVIEECRRAGEELAARAGEMADAHG